MTLHESLPGLALDIDGALLHIGRSDIVEQLREAAIERWEYEEFSDIAVIYLNPGDTPELRMAASEEIVSIVDELGVLVQADARGRVATVEVNGGKDVFEKLEGFRGTAGKGAP